MTNLTVTILAGGLGKRMKSDIPKVLHCVRGEPMIVRLIKEVMILNPDKIIIVVGKFKKIISDEINCHIQNAPIVYVDQENPLGTGHAVKCTLSELSSCDNIILNGDVPLLRAQTIMEIYGDYLQKTSKMMITSIYLDNPTGNGRIIQNSNGKFNAIVEEKDCTDEQRLIRLVNCGIYICSSELLHKFIPLITNNNAQNEYYLTDLVKLYVKTKGLVDLHILDQKREIEIYNVNTKEQLIQLNETCVF